MGCPVPIRFREGTGSAFLAQTLKTIPFVKARRAWAKRQPRPGGLGKQFRKRPERRRLGTFPQPHLAAISMDPVANQAKPIFKIARSRLERVGVDRERSA